MESVNEVVQAMEARIERQVIAIYLRGSRLRGLHHEKSDYDITVIINPTKRELLCQKDFSHRIKLPEYNTEGNVFTTAHLYMLLLKGSPNNLEMIHSYPVFCSAQFKPIADYLYTNRSQIVVSRKYSFVNSCINMAREQKKRFERSKASPKPAIVAMIALYHIKAVMLGQTLDQYIPFSGDEKKELLAFKTVEQVNFDSIDEIEALDIASIHDGDEHIFFELEDLLFSQLF